MEIITDGERYAIRRGWWFPGYQYADLESHNIWWTELENTSYYKVIASKEEVATVYYKLKSLEKKKFKVVKVEDLDLPVF